MEEAPKKLKLTPAAQRDLNGIWDYTAEVWSASQAEKYLAGIEARFTAVCVSPYVARERFEFDPPIRIHRYRSHLIIYLVRQDIVSVVRVLHARQNWQVFLEGDG